MYISRPQNSGMRHGLIYIARLANKSTPRNGGQLIWTTLWKHEDTPEISIDAKQVPRLLRRQAYYLLRKDRP
jgi:hypothetical protein